MITLQAAQGSPEWHAHRAQALNASDAPAMLDCSAYKSRAELVRQMATGVTPETSPEQQRRFDNGHRLEALARPVAEGIIGEELFPVVGYTNIDTPHGERRLSASFDGLTMGGDVGFEHKQLLTIEDKPLDADMQKAYDDGHKAASAGEPQTACPVMRGELCIQWVIGWKAWHEQNNTEWWQEHGDADDLGGEAA